MSHLNCLVVYIGTFAVSLINFVRQIPIIIKLEKKNGIETRYIVQQAEP